MRLNSLRFIALSLFTLLVSFAGCKLLLGESTTTQSKNPKVTRLPQTLAIQTFTDSLPGTAVAGAAGAVWMGTAKGLVRFDLAHEGTSSVITVKDGLPSNQVTAVSVDATGSLWVATSVGLAHQVKGAWKAMAGPAIGEQINALATTSDGALWVAGPDGLARLSVKKPAFEKLLGDVAVTALATNGAEVWVGTAKNYVARVTTDKTGDKVQVYGPQQGNEVEKVRSLVATGKGVIVLGDGGGFPRVAFFDGERFFSYRVKVPVGARLEWLRKVGDDLVAGGAGGVFTLARDGDKTVAGERPNDADGMAANASLVALRAIEVVTPNEGPARGALPPLVAEKVDAPAKDDAKGAKGKGKGAKAPAKAAKPATEKVEAKPAVAPAAAPAGAAAAHPDGGVPPVAAAPAPAPQAPVVPSPVFTMTAWKVKLPDGITAVAPDGPQLIVATRANGAAIVGQDQVKGFHRGDLGENAFKITVACSAETDCWITTGNNKPWRWDGKTFEVSDVADDPTTKVMAVLNPPNGNVIALHRSKGESQVHFSTATPDGRWNAMIYRDLGVPAGVPDVTFATFAPNKHLWVGLRYIDTDGDATDYGVAEVDLDKGKTLYHRTAGVMAAADSSRGATLPNDIESGYFRAEESWFGTRSSVVRLKAADATVYGESEGFERELVHDLIDGADGNLWAATVKGVATFDGKRWAFPPETSPMNVKATALAKDYFGAVYVGTRGGVLQATPPNPDSNEPMGVIKLDTGRGLADNNVFDVTADRYGRIWVLTEKGLSLLAR